MLIEDSPEDRDEDEDGAHFEDRIRALGRCDAKLLNGGRPELGPRPALQ